ncbi:FAD-dependent oxidoreductase [Ralstonia flaminis]|jgi:salicylate hydroxylase|uniref:5-methylphenazine-1-carboxylate 1-monooxygenase n=1 Tax=Ralstonia flaminis TaxID=3058597 RepID=A0ABN9JEZ4_9RALS|nr:NAD(P)/FAD-dependent oxidoreductase [Ralstonia sp. LMG 18101]CAJ0807116.1 5-methylphenazine-1-carboxylate 1-monooxygenase [Ralstonia sp. LMG 18101]
MSEPLHVTIVGAGLGGLCLAQGLRRRGIAFDVFERDAAMGSRPQGYRIRIDAAGQRALQDCLPPTRYTLFRKTCAVPARRVNLFDPYLRPLDGRWVDSWHDDDAAEPADLNAHRQTLREVLFDGIGKWVHFGRGHIRHRSREDGRIEVTFGDGATLVTDVLVGADGVHSGVRAQRLPAAEPALTDASVIYGKTYLTPAALARIDDQLPGNTTIVFGDGLAVIIDAMRFAMSPAQLQPGLSEVEPYLYWAVIAQNHRLEAGGSADACVAKLAAGWAHGLRALFAYGDAASTVMLPVRATQSLVPWASSRVTLLGDAIHAMSPAGGLGANTALTDAANLAAWLGEVRQGRVGLDAAIAGYEAVLRETTARAIDASRKGTDVLLGALA